MDENKEKIEYEPFGDEWRKEMKKNNKAFLIAVYRDTCRQVIDLKKENEKLENAIRHALKALSESDDIKACDILEMAINPPGAGNRKKVIN